MKWMMDSTTHCHELANVIRLVHGRLGTEEGGV